MVSVQVRQDESVSRLTSDLVKGLTAFLVVAIVAFLSIYRQSSPAALPEGAPATEFSAGRAFKYLQVIAQKPHPIGSPEHALVRDYLVDELKKLELTPEVQKTFAVNQRRGGIFNAGAVENITAKLQGTASEKAILLAAHYDTVPNSPGANDDGSGVAAILETIRTLKANTPLKNDVIVLFTDGEEPGLLGAQAFVDEHRWAKEVGLVLNFEARGAGGPVMMFETSNGNGWLIDQFAKSSPHPVANSLLYEFYKVLPNDTDLTAFKKTGVEGLNFAYIAGASRYHTATDSLENVDARSLQHQGSYALSLTRHFGNLNWSAGEHGNRVYFDLLGLTVINYPTSWAIPIAGLVGLIFVLALVMGFRKGALSGKQIFLGALAFLGSLIAIAVLVIALWWLIRATHGQYRAIRSDTYNSILYLASFVALTICLVSLLQIRLRKRITVWNLWAGALVWWFILMIATSIFLPGASYLFTWPLLFSLIALGLLFPSTGRASGPVKTSVAIGVGPLAGIALWAPLLVLLFLGLTVSAAPLVMVLLGLLLGLNIMQLNLMTTPNRWLLPAGLAVVGLSFIVAGALTATADRNHPRQTHLFCGLDADTGKAILASGDDEPNEWTSQFFSDGAAKTTLDDYFPFSPRRFLTKSIESPSLTPPSAVLANDERDGNVRSLTMRLVSPRKAPVVSVHVVSDADVQGFRINGRRIDPDSNAVRSGRDVRWQLHFYGLPAEGIELTLQTKPDQPLSIRVVDQSYGLPETMSRFSRRSDNLIPSPLPFSDTTLVSKLFNF